MKTLRMPRLKRLVMAACGSGAVLLAWSGDFSMAEPARPAGSVSLAQAQPAQPRQNVEASIVELHQKLQISPAQEPQFNAVANVMRDNARAEAGAPQQPPANASAVDDLRAYIRYSELEIAGLKKMLPALEGLYTTLSPTQKKAADAVFRQAPGG